MPPANSTTSQTETTTLTSTNIPTEKTTLQDTTITQSSPPNASVVTQVSILYTSNNTKTTTENLTTTTQSRTEYITTKTQIRSERIRKKLLLSDAPTVSNLDSIKKDSDNSYQKIWLIIGLTLLGVFVVSITDYKIIKYTEIMKIKRFLENLQKE